MTEQQVNELVQVRLDKLAALCEAGQNPYEITKYNVTAYHADIRRDFEAVEAAYIAENGALDNASICFLLLIRIFIYSTVIAKRLSSIP